VFNNNYAGLINKNRLVKINRSLVEIGEQEIRVIVNGDISELKDLESVGEGNQTKNLKYYPVKISYSGFKEKNLRAADVKFCEQERRGDIRLKAWTKGTVSVYIDNYYNTYVHSAYIGVEMKFTRKTWLGWVNHNSENYSANGTYFASGHRVTNSGFQPPVTPVSYNFGTNFSGHTSSPSATLYYVQYVSPVWENLDYINVGGTQNFQFIDMNCSNN
jgi:hypothetical protein